MSLVNFVFFKSISNVSRLSRRTNPSYCCRAFAVTYVDYNILVRAFNTHQLQFGVETSKITHETAREVLLGIYRLISTYHFNEASMDDIVNALLRYLSEVLQMWVNTNRWMKDTRRFFLLENLEKISNWRHSKFFSSPSPMRNYRRNIDVRTAEGCPEDIESVFSRFLSSDNLAECHCISGKTQRTARNLTQGKSIRRLLP